MLRSLVLAALVMLGACDDGPQKRPAPGASANPSPAPREVRPAPREVAPTDAAPATPTASPGPDGMYHVRADACSLEIASPTPLEHSQKSASAGSRTATLHEYQGNDWWGSLSYSCSLFEPRLSPVEELVKLAGKREAITKADGAKVQREREIFVGSHPAMQIDLRFGEGLFSRWHVFFADGTLHMHAVLTSKEFAAQGNVGDLLYAASLVERPPQEAVQPPRAPLSGLVDALGTQRRPKPNPMPKYIPKQYACKGARCFGEFTTLGTGRPKTVFVRGHFRNGTWVRSHMRSKPRRH